VTFDPFGDFATEGYLRNFEKEKDLAIVKRAENASFTTGLDVSARGIKRDITDGGKEMLLIHRRRTEPCLREISGPTVTPMEVTSGAPVQIAESCATAPLRPSKSRNVRMGSASPDLRAGLRRRDAERVPIKPIIGIAGNGTCQRFCDNPVWHPGHTYAPVVVDSSTPGKCLRRKTDA
jgi:hypothetical protein